MNSALLKEREEFRKRAMAVPVVENKKRKVEEPPKKNSNKPAASTEKVSLTLMSVIDLKKTCFIFLHVMTVTSQVFQKMKSSMGSTSQYKFGVLTRIVRHMRERHMEGHDHPLSLEDILDETNQLDVSGKTRKWLAEEALKQNPKLKVVEGDKYMYKAPFELRDKKTLLKLLKRKDLNGEGGVYYDDINESLPRCEKIVKNLTADGKIIQIPRPCDKKKVIYYYDHTADLDIDEEFIKQWRSVSVDGVDDEKIEEYLTKQGISSMRDHGKPRVLNHKRKLKSRKRTRAPRDNVHMEGILQDYSELTAAKAEK